MAVTSIKATLNVGGGVSMISASCDIVEFSSVAFETGAGRGVSDGGIPHISPLLIASGVPVL